MKILHRVGIKSDSSKIARALTTDEGLSGWWTENTSGAGDIGSIIDFRFGEQSVLMKVINLEDGKHIAWECVSSPNVAWVGTEVHFELTAKDEQTFVNFSHIKWPEQDTFFMHCSMKWAVFMLSLKQFIETGQGAAAPNDIQIDHG